MKKLFTFFILFLFLNASIQNNDTEKTYNFEKDLLKIQEVILNTHPGLLSYPLQSISETEFKNIINEALPETKNCTKIEFYYTAIKILARVLELSVQLLFLQLR